MLPKTIEKHLLLVRMSMKILNFHFLRRGHLDWGFLNMARECYCLWLRQYIILPLGNFLWVFIPCQAFD